ncbi:hypothetical protein AIOL_000514 [Candidatus Rhodobacter oscarellae]|uniref:Uncharacterized protein n=1 Tax=Candidatus Rhodobacter oscarellae TaxID=1675527 RepID=A0A0J9ECI1_9RHOB|nr:hypothetical protein [Candidatus Rhodobacter lobularis]KMW60361.1 hypothetical protein AIOL_000514 [Candidatus Rhodobacter lobularis]
MWYRIDAVDRVAELSADWEVYAERNKARGLLPKMVIGRPIWAFLDGAAVNYHYAQIFETVRQTGAPAQFRMRSDGPNRQTLLEISITPEPRQSLKVESRVVRERAVSYSPLWDRSLPRSSELVIACSWCKAVKLDQNWLPVLEASGVRPELRSGCPPEVVHDVCPGCARMLQQERAAAFA